MTENDHKKYVTNAELKEELDKRPTKYEVLFYVAAATLVGRFVPPDPIKPTVGLIMGVVQWLF